MMLEDSTNDSPAAGVVTVFKSPGHGCTAEACAIQKRKYLTFPKPYSIPCFRTSFSKKDMTFDSNVSIATGQECIGSNFPQLG